MADGRETVDADVVVVGAGIAGIVAARQLARAGRSVVVLEKDGHTGGRVRTVRRDDWYAEYGGIFQTHGYHATRALLDEVGLLGEVRPTETGFHSAVRDGDGWRFVDFGSVTGPLLTGILGWRDTLSVVRAALPALLARPRDLGDLVAVRRFDTHDVTRDLTERAASHFTAGPHEFLWGVPSDRLSFALLAAQLHVFTGELREIRGGSGRLVDALAEGLDVRHGTAVTRVESTDDGVEVHVDDAARPWRARSALLACTADVAATLWADAPAPVAEYLGSIDYSRIDYVYLRTREELTMSAEGRPVGMEVVTSAEVDEGTTIGGIYAANHWAGDGGLLLVTAAYAAGAGDLDDETLADRLQADAEKLHPELVGQVTERYVVRQPHYVAIPHPGSVNALAALREHLPHGRVDLAGDHMSAPWLEGAVRSGQQAADRIAATLG